MRPKGTYLRSRVEVKARLARTKHAQEDLGKRMAELRKLPPPTIEEVRAQFEASANYSNMRYGKFRWKDNGLDAKTKATHIIR